MPEGADTVFMQEDVRAGRGRAAVIVPPGLKRGANRRLAGEDVRAGAVVLPAGRRLAAAACRARGRRRPERASGAPPRPGRGVLDRRRNRRARPVAPCAALFDANRYLLAGLIERLGAASTDLGILPDDPDKLARAIAAAAVGHDLVLTSGGVSTGEADHVRNAVERIGQLVFWRVGIKPGRPVAMGVVRGASPGDGAAFVGLPGNPVAVFVTFARVVRPLLLRLAGAEALPLRPVAGARGVRLPQEDRPPRICPGQAHARPRTAWSKPSNMPRRARA